MHKMQILNIDKLDDNLWKSFYKFYSITSNSLNQETYFDFHKSYINTFSYNTIKYEILIKAKKVIGRIETHISNPRTSKEIHSINFLFLNDIDISSLDEILHKYLNSVKLSVNEIKIESNNNVLIDIAKKINFKWTNKLIDFSLKLSNLEKKKLNIFQKIKVNNLYCKIVSQLTKDEIEDLAFVYSTLLNEMERENTNQVFNITAQDLFNYISECSKFNKKILFILLKDTTNNSIVGFSFIDFIIKNNVAYQQFTGITKEFRKNNLSYFLKAKLYSHILKNEQQIEYIKTDCFEKNIPIIKTNKTFGFKVDKIINELYFKGKST